MKNINILILLLLTMVLFSGTAFACGTDPEFNNDAQRQLDCLRKIYWGLGSMQTSSANAVPDTSVTKEIQAVKQGILASNSSLASIEIKSGSNLVILIKDILLADYVYKIVVIFGVGYLVTRSLFKR